MDYLRIPPYFVRCKRIPQEDVYEDEEQDQHDHGPRCDRFGLCVRVGLQSLSPLEVYGFDLKYLFSSGSATWGRLLSQEESHPQRKATPCRRLSSAVNEEAFPMMK